MIYLDLSMLFHLIINTHTILYIYMYMKVAGKNIIQIGEYIMM